MAFWRWLFGNRERERADPPPLRDPPNKAGPPEFTSILPTDALAEGIAAQIKEEWGKIIATVANECGWFFVYSDRLPEFCSSSVDRESAIADFKNITAAAAALNFALHRQTSDPAVRLSRVVAMLTQRSKLEEPHGISLMFHACKIVLPELRLVLGSRDPVFADLVNPVVTHLARCYAASMNSAGLESLISMVFREAEVEPPAGYYEVTRAVTALENAITIDRELRKGPGITQFAVRNRNNIPKSEMAQSVHYMEALGFLRRTPTERTFRLYPGRPQCSGSALNASASG